MHAVNTRPTVQQTIRKLRRLRAKAKRDGRHGDAAYAHGAIDALQGKDADGLHHGAHAGCYIRAWAQVHGF